MTLERIKPPGGAWETTVENGGSPVDQSFALVTDPDTFVSGDHIIDLGSDGLWLFHITLSDIAGDPDGETWGANGGGDPGQILVDLESVQTSDDSASWRAGIGIGNPSTSIWVDDSSNPPDSAAFEARFISLRYVNVKNFRIIDASSFDTYAGANHPSASATAHFLASK